MRRIGVLGKQIVAENDELSDSGFSKSVSQDSLCIKDERTGRLYNIPVHHNSIDAPLLKSIKSPGSSGLKVYDPGYMNTCVCTSRITYTDGEKGILRYRGYSIESLAEQSTFEEISFLLMYGELPTKDQLLRFSLTLRRLSHFPRDIENLISTFQKDAHPMGILMSSLAAMGTCYPEVNPCLSGQSVYQNKKLRNKHLFHVLAAMPLLAANILRHCEGCPFATPDISLGFTENFLSMIDQVGNVRIKPHPELSRAMEVLFILHADHELNCSTAAVRHVASSNADLYTSIAAGIGALYGPRHGGANEAVVRMLERIGSADKVPEFISLVKSRKEKLMGFGHRVYKYYDPRAQIIRKVAENVFRIVGKSPLISIAIELERVALQDTYFTSRRLYPNVDFYSGVIYKAMGFPAEFFPVLFSVARAAGWIAHFNEFCDDKENRIARPFQIYLGHGLRDFEAINERETRIRNEDLEVYTTPSENRRIACGYFSS